MQQFIIGREGTQRFPIPDTKTRVSRKHASLTIADDGRWILEDLDSANGTYIINEQGEMQEVKRMVIHEFTRIILGDQTKMGYTFLAHHLLEENPNDYREEFRYVLELHDKALEEKARIDQAQQRKSNFRYIPPIISALCGLVLTFLLPPDVKPYGIYVTLIFTTLLTVLINKKTGSNKELQQFNTHYSRLLLCPHCGKPLTEIEFKNQMCNACQARA